MGENLTFLLPLVLILFGVAFLVVARFGSRPARFWGAGYLCAATGFLMPLFLGVIPPQAVSLIANAAFFSAFFLYSHALLTHFSGAKLLWLRGAIVFSAYAAIAYAVLVERSLRVELLIGDLALSALLVTALVGSFRNVSQPVDKALFGAVVFVIAETSIRSVVFFVVAGTPDIDAFLGSSYAYAMQITATIGAMLLALTALASGALRLLDGHRKAAEEDPLTGLLNRRGFERTVQEHSGLTVGQGTVIVADIDWFKSINDRHGHAVGDAVLRDVGRLLTSLSWPGLAVARFGGEEFIAYLPKCRLQDAQVLASALRITLSESDWGHLGIDRPITASFGVSATIDGDATIHDAISRADRLLYLAKNSGRNRVVSSAADVSVQEENGPRLFVVRDGRA